MQTSWWNKTKHEAATERRIYNKRSKISFVLSITIIKVRKLKVLCLEDFLSPHFFSLISVLHAPRNPTSKAAPAKTALIFLLCLSLIKGWTALHLRPGILTNPPKRKDARWTLDAPRNCWRLEPRMSWLQFSIVCACISFHNPKRCTIFVQFPQQKNCDISCENSHKDPEVWCKTAY